MKVGLLGAAPLVLCLSAAAASAQQAISTPILTSVNNFRDIAGISAADGGTGTADTTSNNGVMRTGVFYRSNVLTLSAADLATISTLGITEVVDLRTPSEIASTPDVVPIGANYLNVNILGTFYAAPTATLPSPAAAVALLQGENQGFVTDPTERAALHSVFIDLANGSSPALFNDSAGKDRVGWVAAVLQSIAGVSPTTIMNDYLATNAYSAATINSMLAQISAMAGGGAAGANAASLYAPILGVQPSFLQAGLNQVAASYGSMNSYLMQGLDLSQADIYVLRAKMVQYLTLPGQAGFVGNAAAGAAFLNALQNSPLSGHYTAYNYYLQSAIDAGTLGGVESRVGGQVHADAASYLLRQPLRIDDAIAPYASGSGLAAGQTKVWLADLAGYFATEGRAGTADSTELSAGPLLGVTYRLADQASVDLGIGYGWGEVGSAGATAAVDTSLVTLGARYALSSLETGAYAAGRVDAGWVDYDSKRPLGGGLGTARGSANGAVYGGRADLGYVFAAAPVTLTPQVGARVAHATLDGFNEHGSQLALNVAGIDRTATSLLADLRVSLDGQQFDDWTFAPAVTFGYERVLSNPQVASGGTLYGFAVGQNSAYDSRDLVKAGIGVSARRGAFSVQAGVDAVGGGGTKSTGIGARLSLGYKF